MTAARASLTVLVVTAAMLGSGSAQATAVSSVTGDYTAHWALESGGSSCYDPHSWVWRATRAERVSVEIHWERPCEIGQIDCDRQPESMVDESEIDQATQFCTLKQAQHEKSEREELFDNESCLEAALGLESIQPEAPEPIDPGSQLVCRESDPECHSMPPVPETDTPVPSSPSGLALASSPQLAVDEHDGWPSPDARARRGVQRRVDRPPALQLGSLN